MSLDALFDPESIAVVGASTTPGKLGHEAMANLQTFDGPVTPVNPNADGDLFGRPFAASAAETDADLAVLCVPASAVPAVLRECGEAGVEGAIVYAGGFAEAGNLDRQRAVAAAAAEYDVSVLGPNTSGFLRPARGLYASFVGGVERVPAGDVAVIAQSGGVAHAMAFRAVREGRGLAAMVGLGNRAGVDFQAAVEFFDATPETDAILLHVEGTDDARGLLETCGAVETPVVAYTVGGEDVAAFAESHTGALTGSYELYEAGFRQYGVPTVDSVIEGLDAAQALATGPRPTGPNVGVVTAQAGPGIIIADRLRAAGAALPTLTDETRAAVDEHLPGITYAENPVDTGRPMPAFGEVVAAVARDPGVDAVVVYELYESGLGLPVDALDGLAAETGTPIVFSTGGDVPDDELAALADGGCTVCCSPERGADTAAALAAYGRLAGDPPVDDEEEVAR
jgi:acetyltransferase